MLRSLRYLFLALVAIVLVVLALANRQAVTLRLMPEQMGNYLGVAWRYQMPLFLVILGAVALGLLIGFVWEWLREHKHRANERRERRRADTIEREAERQGMRRRGEGNDVLAILDDRRRSG